MARLTRPADRKPRRPRHLLKWVVGVVSTLVVVYAFLAASTASMEGPNQFTLLSHVGGSLGFLWAVIVVLLALFV